MLHEQPDIEAVCLALAQLPATCGGYWSALTRRRHPGLPGVDSLDPVTSERRALGPRPWPGTALAVRNRGGQTTLDCGASGYEGMFGRA